MTIAGSTALSLVASSETATSVIPEPSSEQLIEFLKPNLSEIIADAGILEDDLKDFDIADIVEMEVIRTLATRQWKKREVTKLIGEKMTVNLQQKAASKQAPVVQPPTSVDDGLRSETPISPANVDVAKTEPMQIPSSALDAPPANDSPAAPALTKPTSMRAILVRGPTAKVTVVPKPGTPDPRVDLKAFKSNLVDEFKVTLPDWVFFNWQLAAAVRLHVLRQITQVMERQNKIDTSGPYKAKLKQFRYLVLQPKIDALNLVLTGYFNFASERDPRASDANIEEAELRALHDSCLSEIFALPKDPAEIEVERKRDADAADLRRQDEEAKIAAGRDKAAKRQGRIDAIVGQFVQAEYFNTMTNDDRCKIAENIVKKYGDLDDVEDMLGAKAIGLLRQATDERARGKSAEADAKEIEAFAYGALVNLEPDAVRLLLQEKIEEQSKAQKVPFSQTTTGIEGPKSRRQIEAERRAKQSKKDKKKEAKNGRDK